jgi:hypothetical protein
MHSEELAALLSDVVSAAREYLTGRGLPVHIPGGGMVWPIDRLLASLAKAESMLAAACPSDACPEPLPELSQFSTE